MDSWNGLEMAGVCCSKASVNLFIAQITGTSGSTVDAIVHSLKKV